MNKRISIGVFFLLVSPFLFAQVPGKSFKSYLKTDSALSYSFVPVQINGQSKLKNGQISISPFHLPVNNRLNFSWEKDSSVIVIRGSNNAPVSIERKAVKLKNAKTESATQNCYHFLEDIKSFMQIEEPQKSFFVSGVEEDTFGIQHIRMYQKYKGFRVYNTDFYIHLSTGNEIFNGKYCIINDDVDIDPKISTSTALNVVTVDLKKKDNYYDLTSAQKSFLNYDSPQIDTVILEKSDIHPSYVLAYFITIRPNFIDEWFYFVNATNGAIIDKYNNTKFDGPEFATGKDLNGVSRTFNTYQEKGLYYMMNISLPMYNATKNEGFILTLDAQNTPSTTLDYKQITSVDNLWTNPTAVSAHFNASQTYSYFKNTFNRNSINDKGGNIISLINVASEEGESMENAFWNGAAVFYGNGGNSLKPLAGALDVTAHEIGHGVIGNTANLEYKGQSGAINESYADIFGSMVDRDDWFIGEDITKTSYISTGMLRDMSNPHNDGINGWQPAHTSEMYLGLDDNGGVHTNSGIINHAFYLFATATSKEKAEQVFYRALKTYLTKSAQFIDLRIAVILAAKDLYGDNSDEVIQVAIAFNAVGIYEEQPVVADQNYAVNPGQDYLLMTNTDTTDIVTFYQCSIAGSDFVPLSATVMKRKASVVDDGSAALIVTDKNQLKAVSLNPINPAENLISNDAIWDNVAISKDGARMAVITTSVDTSIFLYDFESRIWAKFKLYNPTTQENIKSGGVLYADAIEFDITGEYVIYDAFNSINSSNGNNIEYWDIGIMKVWDNKTNSFGDGIISKLFGSLPDSVSIGNPVFSKNSPNIIAFDYFDEANKEYAILGLNIETRDLNLITDNNAVGFPSFSRLDDKIAFTAYDALGNSIIKQAILNSDKISSDVPASDLVFLAKWPVFFATGQRPLGLAPKANFTASYKSGQAPLTVLYSDLSINEPAYWEWTFEGGNPTTSVIQNPTVTYSTPGLYSVKLKTGNTFGSNTLQKTNYIAIAKVNSVLNQTNTFSVYPNPVRDYLYLSSTIPIPYNSIAKIYALDGTLVQTGSLSDKIDFSEVNAGLYILKIQIGKEVFQVKVVKE